MPIMELHLLEGNTPEQKQAIATALTEALMKSADVRLEQCIILFHDVPLQNYSNAGLTAATRVQQGKTPTTN